MVAERAENVWEKYVKLLIFWKTLPNSKQPGQDKPGANTSYDTSLKKSDLLVPVKLKFFKEVADCLNSLLVIYKLMYLWSLYFLINLRKLLDSAVRSLFFL